LSSCYESEKHTYIIIPAVVVVVPQLIVFAWVIYTTATTTTNAKNSCNATRKKRHSESCYYYTVSSYIEYNNIWMREETIWSNEIILSFDDSEYISVQVGRLRFFSVSTAVQRENELWNSGCPFAAAVGCELVNTVPFLVCKNMHII